MELVRRSVKVRIAAAVMAAGLLGLLAGYADDAFEAAPVIGSFDLQSHKADHPPPPGCTKQHQYGKHPEKKCQNQNP